MAIIESLPCSQKALTCSQEAELFKKKMTLKMLSSWNLAIAKVASKIRYKEHAELFTIHPKSLTFQLIRR